MASMRRRFFLILFGLAIESGLGWGNTVHLPLPGLEEAQLANRSFDWVDLGDGRWGLLSSSPRHFGCDHGGEEELSGVVNHER